MLYCSAVQSSVDISLSGLWPKLNWEAPGSGSRLGDILFMGEMVRMWAADMTRRQGSLLDCSHACSRGIVVRSLESMEEGGRIYGGGWIWS
jgi:hypothetical protein